eukprot:scaffold1554_cov401-Prasinococcus_capsulatus_cf.AAC.3
MTTSTGLASERRCHGPYFASSTGVILIIFIARVLPREVTASPSSSHSAAMKAAMLSVVPAHTLHVGDNPYRCLAASDTLAIGEPGALTVSGSMLAKFCCASHGGHRSSTGSYPSLRALFQSVHLLVPAFKRVPSVLVSTRGKQSLCSTPCSQ